MNEAIKLLGQMTGGRFDIYNLAGPYNAKNRVQIMAVLQGVKKVPQSKAGVNAIREAFYAVIQPEGNCIAAREDSFVEYCRAVVQQ